MKFELRTLSDYSDEALLAEVRRVAALLNGERITRERFNELACAHSSTLEGRFGSWRAALELAGVAPRPNLLTRSDVLETLRALSTTCPGTTVTAQFVAAELKMDRNSMTRRFGPWKSLLIDAGLPAAPSGRRYSDEECFENLLALWVRLGRQPRYAELKKPPSIVGPKAYILRWGGWRAALAAFVSRVNHVDTMQSEPQELPAGGTEAGKGIVGAEPRSPSLALRYRVLVRDRFRCVICGASPAKDLATELQVDHVIPWSKGGMSTEQNLRTLCSLCNLGKGAREDEQRGHNHPQRLLET